LRSEDEPPLPRHLLDEIRAELNQLRRMLD
jgi:hypothetical protein